MVSTSTRELMAIMPPPEGIALRAGGWEEAESDFGLRLPSDYKEFIEIYGPGAIGSELGVPDYRKPEFRTSWVKKQPLPGPRDLNPLPVHPADGPALFPLAANGSGHRVYGIAVGGMVSDKVIWVGYAKHAIWVRADGPFNHFLASLVSGELQDIYETMDEELWKLPPIFRRTYSPPKAVYPFRFIS